MLLFIPCFLDAWSWIFDYLVSIFISVFQDVNWYILSQWFASNFQYSYLLIYIKINQILEKFSMQLYVENKERIIIMTKEIGDSCSIFKNTKYSYLMIVWYLPSVHINSSKRPKYILQLQLACINKYIYFNVSKMLSSAIDLILMLGFSCLLLFSAHYVSHIFTLMMHCELIEGCILQLICWDYI